MNNLTVRTLFFTMSAFLVLPSYAGAYSSSPRHGMVVTQPAHTWKEALPLGNGSVGAMAYGDPHKETILLNHEALFYPVWPKPQEVPYMAQYLPELRCMLMRGSYKEAENFWNSKLAEHDYGLQRCPFTNPYHPAFDLVIALKLDEPQHGPIRNYRQRLDFETAQVTAAWTQGDIEFERRMFVSRTDDVVVLHLRSSKPGSVTADVQFRPHDPQSDIFPVRMGRDADYLLARKAYKADPIEYTLTAKGRWLSLQGTYWDWRRFGAVARVIAKGTKPHAADGAVRVDQADEVLVVLKLFANERSGDNALKRLRRELGRLDAEYEKLFDPHAGKHRELFSRMSLDLKADDERVLSNKQMLAQAKAGRMPRALVERLFEFGRYILICSSRPGGLPANLQGLWSGTWTPSWSCDYTINENIQMAYWQALPGNLTEVTKPYFDYFDSLIPDWRTNARQFYGCRGVVSFLRHSDHGLIVQDAPWQFWTAGAGWLGQLYYDYYLFTRDKNFLADRVVPFLKEVALFYEDFLFAGPDGSYIFAPSMSPENAPANTRSKTALNAAMDIAVAKEVLTNLIAGQEKLSAEDDALERWRKILANLPAYQFEDGGAMKEWVHPDLRNNDDHRHMSHIYPLFPGFEVNADDGDAVLRRGCRIVLERKFADADEGFGWSLAHQALGFARLGDGEKALECLRRTAGTCSEKNLFSFFRPPKGPFQIDGNCGFSAAALEMLLYSKPGFIKLLPALPQSWPQGKAERMLCRAGVEVSIDWDMPKQKIHVTLNSLRQQTVMVKLPRPAATLDVTGAVKWQRSDRGPEYLNVTLTAARLVSLVAGLEPEEPARQVTQPFLKGHTQ